MKLIKMLGLAMVAAIAAMALIGAGTASASTLHLCEGESYNECVEAGASAHDLENGTKLHANLVAGVTARFQASFVTIECTTSKVQGEVTVAQPTAGNQIEGKITEVTFENCATSAGNCTLTKAIQLPWRMHVQQQRSKANGEEQTEGEEAEGKGTFIGNGRSWINPEPPTAPEGEQPGGEFTCPIPFFGSHHCTYHVNETQPGYAVGKAGKLHVIGGKPMKLKANQIKLKKVAPSDSICTATAEWCAEYEIQSIKQPTKEEKVKPKLFVIHRL